MAPSGPASESSCACLSLIGDREEAIELDLVDVLDEAAIGGKATVDATVAYVHPIHNFALVRFDAKSVAVRAPNDDTGASGVLPSARLSEQVLQPGDEVEFIGLSARRTGSVVCQRGLVGEKEAVEHAKTTGHTNFSEFK